MARQNSPNFRSYVKYLIKNLQRGEIVPEEVHQWLLGRGIWVNKIDFNSKWPWECLEVLNSVLRDNTSGRIWSRLGNAAKKQGKFIRLHDIISVSVWKNVPAQLMNKAKYQNYHTIPFLGYGEVQVTKKGLVDPDGNLVEEIK